ncbi:MAG: hypothetical protein FWD13_09565 [Treponema sp.]|nr:hypothetical protein [Treponema sp.]
MPDKNLKPIIAIIFGLIISTHAAAQSNTIVGTWVLDIGGITNIGNQVEMIFDNNGSIESRLDGVPLTRGHYTASNGRYTTQTTSVYGSSFRIEARWYSQQELRNALRNMFLQLMSIHDFNELIDSMFASETGTFSISGNILTMRKDGETESFKYIRR